MALSQVPTEPINTRLLSSATDAAALLQAGRLVAFPTETVYGLGAAATNSAAIERLFAAKGRPADNPLIVHVGTVADWRLAARELTPAAEAFLATFAPGPITVILPKQHSISPLVTAGLDTIGLRIPACPVASELLTAVAIPIAAPSANRSGRPSCTTWQAVLEDLDGRIDGVLQGQVSQVGIESTVVDCTGPIPVLLRPGAISLADLQSVIPSTVSIAEQLADEPGQIRSPGTRHPHYQPSALVQLVEHPDNLPDHSKQGDGSLPSLAYAGLTPIARPELLTHYALFDSVEAYATSFYEFLRMSDRLRVEVIYLQQVPEAGIGQALRDRLRRAAGAVSP